MHQRDIFRPIGYSNRTLRMDVVSCDVSVGEVNTAKKTINCYNVGCASHSARLRSPVATAPTDRRFVSDVWQAEGLTDSVAKDLLKSSYTQLWTSSRRASHNFMR